MLILYFILFIANKSKEQTKAEMYNNNLKMVLEGRISF